MEKQAHKLVSVGLKLNQAELEMLDKARGDKTRSAMAQLIVIRYLTREVQPSIREMAEINNRMDRMIKTTNKLVQSNQSTLEEFRDMIKSLNTSHPTGAAAPGKPARPEAENRTSNENLEATLKLFKDITLQIILADEKLKSNMSKSLIDKLRS